MSEEKTIRTNARQPVRAVSENRYKIAAMLDRCQKGASVRIVYVPEIIGAAMQLEKHLENLGIDKKDRVGTLAMWSPFAGNVPRSYKYRPQGTVVTFERRATGWFVVDVERTVVGNTESYGKGSQPKYAFFFPLSIQEYIKMKALRTAQFPEAI